MYKILIVDDEEKIRKVLREYAEFEGFSVVEAVMVTRQSNLLKRVILILSLWIS